MDKQDARRLEPAAQFELRKQTIGAWMRGQNRGQISEEVGLSYPAVCKIVQRYRMNEEQGLNALAPLQRGRRYGEDRVLSMEQELLIQRLMYEKRPEQMAINAALWNRKALIELIARECRVGLSVRGVGNYLKRWGFATQKPLRYSGDCYAGPLNKWLCDEYTALAERVKAEAAEIHWCDENALQRSADHSPEFSPVTESRVIYSVTNQGKVRWMLVDEACLAAAWIEFMAALIREAGRKVFLVLDALHEHQSPSVKAWVEAHQDKIELCIRPVCAHRHLR